MGRAGRPAVAVLPPRRHADRAGAGRRRRRAGTPPSACTAPTSSISSPPHLPAGIVHTGHRAIGFEQNGDIARVSFANGATVEADVVVAADGIHSELRPYVFPPSKPVFHGTISYRGLVPRERLPDWPMDRWQMWAGPSKHFLVFPVRHGDDGQLRRLRADRRGDEGIVVGARRPRRAARASSKAGTRASARCCAQVDKTLPLGAVRPRAAADLDQGPADAARRRRASDAAASRPGREPVDRGRHGARDDPVARPTTPACRRRCWPTSGCAASASPRCSSARGRTGCGSIRPTPTSRMRDAELARARRIPQAPLRVRRGAGGEEGGDGGGLAEHCLVFCNHRSGLLIMLHEILKADYFKNLRCSTGSHWRNNHRRTARGLGHLTSHRI